MPYYSLDSLQVIWWNWSTAASQTVARVRNVAVIFYPKIILKISLKSSSDLFSVKLWSFVSLQRLRHAPIFFFEVRYDCFPVSVQLTLIFS